MRRLYRAANMVEAMHLKSLLDSARIDNFLRNENMMRVAGEVPFDQCWPEVWIREEDDRKMAEEILGVFRNRHRQRGPAWSCPQCNEWLEGQFTACWQCGAQRPL